MPFSKYDLGVLIPRGRFIHHNSGIILPNTLMNLGAELLLKMLFQGEPIGGGGKFFVGLCGDVFTGKGMDLTDIVGEPVGFGYAREGLEIGAPEWPDPVTTNDITKIASKVVTFTGSGGDFSTSISRMFLTNVASGTAGVLFALSASLDVPLLVLDGVGSDFTYEFFFI